MEKDQLDLVRVERSIRVIRGDKVILDEDLAELYGVETKQLIRAVKRSAGCGQVPNSISKSNSSGHIFL